MDEKVARWTRNHVACSFKWYDCVGRWRGPICGALGALCRVHREVPGTGYTLRRLFAGDDRAVEAKPQLRVQEAHWLVYGRRSGRVACGRAAVALGRRRGWVGRCGAAAVLCASSSDRSPNQGQYSFRHWPYPHTVSLLNGSSMEDDSQSSYHPERKGISIWQPMTKT